MKLFYKKRLSNGQRYIYFCGVKIFSYSHNKSHRYLKRINYKQYNDIAFDIKRHITKIPADVDLVVGVPRSGIIPAYMISFALNKQVCSLPEFLDGKFGENGFSRKIDKHDIIRKVLIVDDTCNTGMAMKSVKQRLESVSNKYEYVFCCVYGSDKTVFNYCDIVLSFLPQPRMFQWNYLNHGFLANAAFDMDGVLCVDPTEKENDNGKNYEKFLLNAKPLYVPKVKIAAIITSRLEKYRPQTELWLKKHNIEYDKLYMLENTTAEERRCKWLYVLHKATIYKKHKELQIFIESDIHQAQKIAEITHKHVFCATNDMLY